MDKKKFLTIPENYKIEVDLDCVLKIRFQCLNKDECNHSEVTEMSHSHFVKDKLLCPKCNGPLVFKILSNEYYYKNPVHGKRIKVRSLVTDNIIDKSTFLFDYISFYRGIFKKSPKKKKYISDSIVEQLMIHSKAFLHNNMFSESDFNFVFTSDEAKELAKQLYGEDAYTAMKITHI